MKIRMYMGKRGLVLLMLTVIGLCWIFSQPVTGETGSSIAESIKALELAHKDAKGEVYLGKILMINYPINSARVSPKYLERLQELAELLKSPERKNYRVVIRGYTDNTGPRQLNMRLSRMRAEAIKRILVERFNLDPDRIQTEGFGPDNPIATNKTPSGRAKNRRTEIHIYGDVSEAVKALLPAAVEVVKKEEAPPELFKPKKPEPQAATPPKPLRPQPVGRGTVPPVGPLPKALQGLDIKDYFMAVDAKKAGQVQAMQGHVIVVHRGTSEAYYARAGDTIFENDAIYTLDNSRCRIRLFDDDVVAMAANTQFSIDTYVDQRKEKVKKSFFSMLKGKVMFYALRLFRYRTMSFKVNTPTAVVGVRGTKFGIHVYWEDGSATSALPTIVASAQPMGAVVAASGGADGGKSYTDAFCEDGEIGVDGVVVPAGYKYNGKTGQVEPTDPKYLEEFEKDTGVGKGERTFGKKEPSGEVVEIPVEALEESFAEATESASSETNEQNTVAAGPYSGYFFAFLTRNQASDLSLEDTYVTLTPQDFNTGSSPVAQSISSAGDAMTLSSGFVDHSTSYLTRFTSNGGALDSGNLGRSYPLTVTRLGSNDYMEWGYWTMTTPVQVGGSNYYVNNPAWYIFGQLTDNTVISGLSGIVSYTGTAHGTFFTTGGGVRLDGSFSSQVDFGSGVVSDFDLNVTDSSGSYIVGITNASGTITNGHFSLDPQTGSWSIESGGVPDAATGSVNGTFYGPQAEYTGGAWGVVGTTYGDRAGGVFQGSR